MLRGSSCSFHLSFVGAQERHHVLRFQKPAILHSTGSCFRHDLTGLVQLIQPYIASSKVRIHRTNLEVETQRLPFFLNTFFLLAKDLIDDPEVYIRRRLSWIGLAPQLINLDGAGEVSCHEIVVERIYMKFFRGTDALPQGKGFAQHSCSERWPPEV